MIQEEDLKKIETMLRTNLDMSREILANTEKMRKYILWVRILGIVKVVLILTPVIIALFLLPPLLKEVFNNYSDVFKELNAVKSGNVKDFNTDAIRQLIGQ
jgi:hypothetical protein